MISPVQGCLVGASWHVLRPYCYLLFVICYDCARTGLPRRGEQTCVTTLLLFVICYLLWLCPYRAASSGRTDMCYDLIVICYLLFVMIVPSRTANVRPCWRRKMFHGVLRFHRNREAIPPQSRLHRMPIAVSDVSRTVPPHSSHVGNDGSKLTIVCKSISCAKVTGILTPLLAGYDLISYFCNRNPWISA